MRNWKKAASLLLALMPLLLGALLPVLVGLVQDAAMRPGCAPLPPITLIMEEKKELTLVEKMTVLRGAEQYYLDEDTCHTEQTVEYSIQDGLNPFYYRELIPYNWADVTVEAQAYLMYNPEYPEISFPVWDVTLRLPDCQVELTVDDETGKILNIHFMGEAVQNLYTMKGYLIEIMDAWFASMELDESQWELQGQSEEDNDYAQASYAYMDEHNYGGLVVDFYVWDTGFWIY